jgi:hypothetical protein
LAQPTTEKYSPTLDNFFTISSTSTTAVRRKLELRSEMGNKKRRKVNKSKETERRYNSDEEEMLEILENTTDDSFDQDFISPERKKHSERQKDGKEDREQQNKDSERQNDGKEDGEQQNKDGERLNDHDQDFA